MKSERARLRVTTLVVAFALALIFIPMLFVEPATDCPTFVVSGSSTACCLAQVADAGHFEFDPIVVAQVTQQAGKISISAKANHIQYAQGFLFLLQHRRSWAIANAPPGAAHATDERDATPLEHSAIHL